MELEQELELEPAILAAKAAKPLPSGKLMTDLSELLMGYPVTSLQVSPLFQSTNNLIGSQL